MIAGQWATLGGSRNRELNITKEKNKIKENASILVNYYFY